MKKSILTPLLIVLSILLSAQSGSITNIQVLQRTDGSGFVDVYFDMAGTQNNYYINLEASFDGGQMYFPVPANYISGDVGPINPGNSKHIVWDGLGSFPNMYSTRTKIKVIAGTEPLSQNNWQQISDYPAGNRLCQVAFEIGNIGYIGLGRGGSGGIPHDFYSYNPSTDSWQKLADYPGNAGSWAVSFTINGYGYVGTGQIYSDDFYRYDPSSNLWTSLPSIPSSGRSQAFAFSINGKGYVGGGSNTNISGELDDFWEYNPNTNSWSQKANFGGGKRANAVAFVLNNNGYVVGGRDENGYPYHNDMWAYDPQSDSWSEKAEFPENYGGLQYHEGFAINNKGYVYVDFSEEFWEYDPQSDSWSRKADFIGLTRYDTFGLSIGNKGYIGGGWNEENQIQLKDVWVYTP